MSLSNNHKIAILVFVLLAATGYITYSYNAAAQTSKKFDAALQSDVMQLRADFNALSTSASARSFAAVGTPLAQYNADFANADIQIANVSKATTIFEAKYKKHPEAPFTGFLPLYAESNTSSKNVRRMASQTRSVLKAYSNLITNLRTMYLVEGSLEGNQNQLTAVKDFKAQFNKGARYQQTAVTLRKQNKALKAVTMPEDYRVYQGALLTKSSVLAGNLDNLATGLDEGSNSKVDAAAKSITALFADYDKTDKPLRYSANQKSATLQQVRKIAAKLDIFERND